MMSTTGPEVIQGLLGPEAAYFRVENGQVIALEQNAASAPHAKEGAEE